MTADQILTAVTQKGITLEAHANQIVYKAPVGSMTQQLKSAIKAHKQDLLNLLKTNGENLIQGNCEGCPAAGYWDYMGPGKWCFHTTYYLGKSGRPVPCDSAKRDCPLIR